MTRKRTLSLAVLLALLIGLVAFQSATLAKGPDTPQILEFKTMVGVPDAFTGAKAPIRGINGGGIPWMLTSAKGELSATGHLEVKVVGLVLAAGANAGSNPIASFRATVSCLAADASVVNVQTGTFPATSGPATSGGGNAKIEADLSLPQPCIAPIVFVTSPTGSWFASTGG
ncbi:MAG TPA: hypothetical protein VF013_07240 [Candidatus Limnocylindria bacterium]